MAHELVDSLGLHMHPEGGFYKETYRSCTRVRESDRERSACTLIYYLLESGQHSAWHRVLNDEIWHFYQGDAIEVLCMDANCEQVESFTLSPNHDYHCVIPAGAWQAARPLGAYTLVGCTVSPGFEFNDFHLLRDHPRKTYLDKQWHELL